MSDDPYRSGVPVKAPRFSFVIDGVRYSGETFGAVIRELRYAGFTTEQISVVGEAAITTEAGQTTVLTLTTGDP